MRQGWEFGKVDHDLHECMHMHMPMHMHIGCAHVCMGAHWVCMGV